MTDAQTLIGTAYPDLGRASLFRGTELPLLETIEDRSYVSVPERGVSLVLTDHVHVGSVQLYGEGHQGFTRFDGDLPGGIAFGMSRADVRQRLGEPVRSGEPRKLPVLGEKPAWDGFDAPECAVHVEYGPDGGGVRLVTLSGGANRA